MQIRTVIVWLMLLVFGFSTVHAATMGLDRVPETPAALHCHDAGAPVGQDGSSSPAQLPHGQFCHSCLGCVPMMTGALPVWPTVCSGAVLNPKPEASFLAYIPRPHHRPPIVS